MVGAAPKDPWEIEEETRNLETIHCTEHAAAVAPTKLCVKMVMPGGSLYLASGLPVS